jgi:hypothetical protein
MNVKRALKWIAIFFGGIATCEATEPRDLFFKETDMTPNSMTLRWCAVMLAQKTITFIVGGVLIALSVSCSREKAPQDDWPPALKDALEQLTKIQSAACDSLALEEKQKTAELEGVIESEVVAHEERIFKQQMRTLQSAAKKRSYSKSDLDHLVFKSDVERDFFGKGKGVFKLYNMMPLQMTPFLTSYIPQDILDTIRHEKGSCTVLDITNESCQTGLEFSKYLLVACFARDHYRWYPVEVRLYEKRR